MQLQVSAKERVGPFWAFVPVVSRSVAVPDWYPVEWRGNVMSKKRERAVLFWAVG